MVVAIAIGVGLPLALVVVAFSRALTAKLMTGHWPHQDEQARQIYDHLTHNS